MPPASKRIGAPELGMKISGVLARLRKTFVVYVKILIVGLLAFVDQLDQGPFLEGHPDVAVQRATLVKAIRAVRATGCREQLRLVTVDDPMAQPEEISQR